MFLWLFTAPLTAALGYLYPAYMTYKSVERRQPNIDELLFWGKYWIIVGVLEALETVFFGLTVLIPFYSIARLVLLVYLWHPKTQGVLLLYHRGVQPVVMKHEQQIDKTLQEVHTRGTDYAMEQLRRLVGLLQSAMQQGSGMVKNQYQSFSKRNPGPAGAAPYAAQPPLYPPVPPAASPGDGAYAGGPDSMYNLRTRKGYDSKPSY